MEADDRDENTKKIIATVVVLFAVVLVTVGVNALSNKKAKTTTAQTSSTTSSNTSTSTQTYKDGTYVATGNYDSPGGEESIKISVTVKDNIVTDATADGLASDNDAKVYQDSFVEGYKTLVVGKKIRDIHLSRVSGSSLTSQGFNNALDHIKDEAATS